MTCPTAPQLQALEPRLHLSATLVKDINTANSFHPEPDTMIEAGGVAYFVASDTLHGRELWRLDANDQMQLVADLVPGPESSDPVELVELNDTLYFFAQLPSGGHSLMRSDGTSGGTRSVKALSPATHAWLTHDAVSFGDRLLFEERDERLGTSTLYLSDGTAAGTRVLVEAPTSTDWRTRDAVRLGDLFVFVASVPEVQVWASDGTPEGTRAIDLPHADMLRGAYALTIFRESVFFAARHEGTTSAAATHTLWRIDGNRQPRLVRTFDTPDDRYGYILDMAAAGDDFLLYRLNQPDLPELYATDGTHDGVPTLLADDADRYSIADYVFWHRQLYFAGRPDALWRTDGRAVVTVDTADALDGASIVHIIPRDDSLYLVTETPNRFDGRYHYALWKTDGTAAGTIRVGDLGLLSSRPELHRVVGSRLVLGARYDPVIWVSDDANVARVPTPLFATLDSHPELAVAIGETTFFVAHSAHRVHLWRWRAGDAEPEIAHDFDLPIRALHALGDRLIVYLRRTRRGCCPATHALWSIGATGPAVPLTSPTITYPLTYQIAGDTLFFRTSHDDQPPTIYRSDGTPQGTVQVRLKPNLDAPPKGGHVYLALSDEENGNELWLLDKRGARPVKDIAPGNQSSDPRVLATIDGRAFFTANDGVAGLELWTTDGTDDGTVLLTDIRRDGAKKPGHSIGWAGAALGKLWFTVLQRDGDAQLWTSDGTPDGTRPLKRLHVAPHDPELSGPVEFNGLLHFFAPRPDGTLALWSSDGTPRGTRRLRGFPSESDGSAESRLAAAPVIVNDRFYFALRSGGRYHLWSSNGNRLGTRPVRRNLSVPPQLFAAPDRLIFTADDPIRGQELWQLLATRAHETPLADILPGPPSSHPKVLGLFNDNLLISATDAEHGSEPWLVQLE